VRAYDEPIGRVRCVERWQARMVKMRFFGSARRRTARRDFGRDKETRTAVPIRKWGGEKKRKSSERGEKTREGGTLEAY